MAKADPPSTRSEHEVRDRQLFDRIAEHYCRKDLLPAQRLARKLRLDQSLRTLPVGADAAILEVGCGAGFSADYLNGRCSVFHGIDYSEELIRYAQALNVRDGVTFETVNVKDFKAEGQFDVVLMIGVLHHLDDVEVVTRQLVSALKPGGWLVANEPQNGNPLIRGSRRVRKRVDASYSEDQREYSGAELRGIFSGAGLEDIRIVPQGVLSTPFAEVPMPAQGLTRRLSAATCAVDRFIESRGGPWLRYVTWNLVAQGRRPAGGPERALPA
jgi:2-polyprenyl-3-methyl-5-hydroxy-6-metoxy-1,4-benzoquinol methylase